MNYRHAFHIQAPLVDVASFHTTAISLKAITPRLIPVQPHQGPQQMDDGGGVDFTMWMGRLRLSDEEEAACELAPRSSVTPSKSWMQPCRRYEARSSKGDAMIPNQWYVLMESKQVKDGPVGVTRMGEKLTFWRDESGQVSCLRDKCPHRGVQLSKGQVVNGHIQCPFHGFEYDASGRCTLIPANGRNAPVPKTFRAHSYPTHETHGFIWVWWGDSPPDDLAPPRCFDDIGEGFTCKTIYDPWKAHYSRVIENQLDVVHLPFVHRNTIGRGGRTVVDGPGIEWVDEDMFYLYTYNRTDDGTPPRKPSEVPIPDPTKDFKLEFIFPNLWQNHISDDVRIVVAFVPVDEEHTLLYLRFYQRFLTAPLLRDLVAWLAMPFNRLVAHQDRRVVETHQPQPSGLRIGEKMIQGDRPIVEYRRRREALIEAARQDSGNP